MTKTCTKCHALKPMDGFYRNKRKPDGHQGWCKPCFRAYYGRIVEGDRDYFLKYQRSARAKKRARIIEARTMNGCADCGEKHIACLEFHHLDPSVKTDGVTQLVDQNAEWSRIEAEIAKCIVLCCNCHRKRHYAQRRAQYAA